MITNERSLFASQNTDKNCPKLDWKIRIHEAQENLCDSYKKKVCIALLSIVLFWNTNTNYCTGI